MSLGQTEDTVNAAAVLLATGFPILLLVVGGITYWLAGRALAPVEAIRNEVAEVSQADLARRVPVPGTRDEIARLADTMNSMLAGLETAQTTQRRFIADASHELRSPLATLRASLEIADRQHLDANQLDVMRHEVDRMVRMVDDLLLLTRVDEHRLPLHRTEVDLDDLVDAERARLAQTTELAVHARLRPVKVHADPAALSRAIRNLVDNAARHANTTVDLSVTYDATHAVLEVTDDGPGIPETDRQRIFERFVRLDTARQRSSGGAGLGLAIVHEIVTAHDGDVRIVGAPGGGTCFRLRIPLPAQGTSPSA
ncbi:sensor histidine kinase [Saccharopolyspora sp. NPDC003752]